ncbi:hypothetical protein D3C72_2109980 [compost metagenome]
MEPLHDLQDRAGRQGLALDRLIGVGVAAYVDAFADVSGLGEFLFQQTRGFGLEEDPALEIQTRG